MRDLNWYGNYCIEMLNAIDIYPNEIKEFKVNTRAKNRWGITRHNMLEDTYIIEVNAILLDEEVKELSLLETLYHELLHCVDGCMNHGTKWKELAELVNDCYYVDITRTSNITEKLGESVATKYNASIESKYKLFKIQCRECGYEYARKQQRTPKWYNHIENYKCSACGGSLKKL